MAEIAVRLEPVTRRWDEQVVQVLVRVVDRFNAGLLLTLSLGLAVLASLGLAQVVWRYLIGDPLTWSEEVIRYSLIWSVFLGAGIAVRRGLLAAVELVSQLAPPLLQKTLARLCLAISGLFWAVLLGYGIVILESVRGMSSGALEMPMPLVYLAIPVGAAFALINTLTVMVDPSQPASYLLD